MAETNKPLDPLLDLLVQNGVLDDGQVETILEARDRQCAGPTAPPEGLTLVQYKFLPGKK